MSKTKKIVLTMLPVVLIGLLMVTSTVYGIAPPTNDQFGGGTTPSGINTFFNNIWSIVQVAVQFLAVVAIVIAGVRYMLASADTKADIKKQTVTLVIGAVLIFAAFPIVNLVSDLVKNIYK